MTFVKIKPWLILALIFVLGVGTGVSLTIGLGSHFARPPGVQQMKKHMLMGLTHRLNLTTDQQAKIDPILADTETQIQALHREEVGRMSRIMEAMNTQILPLLTPEQQTELQKMRKEMEGQRDRMFPGHMHPWMQPGPGQPPPRPEGVPPTDEPPPGGPPEPPPQST